MDEKVDVEDIKMIMDGFKGLHKSFHGPLTTNQKDELSPDQCRLLFIIDHCKSINQKEIARSLHITPATLSVRLQRLEKAGYLRRDIDPNDKRNYLLTITTKGKELKDRSIKIMEKTWLEIFDGFKKSEILEIITYLERMKENVRNIKEDKQC